MKLFKKYLVVFGVVFVLSGCSDARVESVTDESASNSGEVIKSNSDVDKTALDEIKQAIEVLRNKSESYIVETAVEMPDDSFTYIEVTTPTANYTEYPVDEDGNLGTQHYGTSEDMQYVLMDLILNDEKYYGFNTIGDEFTLNVYPDEYKEWVDGRQLLYVEDMLDSFISLKKEDSKIDVVLDDGELQLTTYSGVLESEKVQEILSNNNIGVYKSLIASEEEGSNIQKLCQEYLKESEMLMTFSDANVMIGVDPSGCLRYMGLEAGGLGSRMYYTKVVINPDNNSLRDLPDVSGAVDLRENFEATANYVAEFNSYEDAMHALDYHDGESASEFYSDDNNESEVIESTETEVLSEVIDNE